MVTILETGEERCSTGESFQVRRVQVEYDFWNSDSYDQDCGFEIELVYREDRNYVTQTQALGSRITPPDTSTDDLPSRARVVLSVPEISCGTFQLRFRNIVGVAFHSVAVEVDERKTYS